MAIIKMNSDSEEKSNGSFYESASETVEKRTTEKRTTEKEATTKETETTEAFSQGKANELVLRYIGKGNAQSEDGKITLFFGFSDEDENELWINANVDVKIVNDDNETVYTGNYDITESDFSTWSNVIRGEMYLASIVIDESNITKGNTKNGTVTLNVTTKSYGLTFEDYNFDIDCLPYNAPSSNCNVTLPQLPLTVNEYNWNGEVMSTVRIDSIDLK